MPQHTWRMPLPSLWSRLTRITILAFVLGIIFASPAVALARGPVALAAATHQVGNPTGMAVVLRWLSLITIAGFAGGFIISMTCLQGVFLKSLGINWAAFWCRVALLVNAAMLAQHLWVLAESTPITLTWVINMLTETQWGQAWLLRSVGLIMFILCTRSLAQVMLKPPSRVAPVAAALSIILVSVTQSLAGHAAQSAFALVLQTLHSLAASVWMGGLIVMVLASAMLMRRSNSYHQQALKQMWVAFSHLAFASVVVLVITGLFNLSQQVLDVSSISGWGAWLMTGYGQTLFVKIVVIAFVIVVTATNGVALRGNAMSITKLLNRARLQVMLGVIILVITALLTASSPANGSGF